MDHPIPKLSKEEVEACEKEAGVNIHDLKNKDSLNEELAEKMDCLHKCIFTKEGALKSDGTIDMDEIKVISIIIINCFNNPVLTKLNFLEKFS